MKKKENNPVVDCYALKDNSKGNYNGTADSNTQRHIQISFLIVDLWYYYAVYFRWLSQYIWNLIKAINYLNPCY